MRYIDADKLIEEANQDGAYGYVSAEQIEKAPTADVVEVVRCKDCRKREKINGITVCPIAWIKAEVSDDDFCSLGERADK